MTDQKDILSDECDKDSGYEPDQVHFWPRSGGAQRTPAPTTSSRSASGWRHKKQRSLDVHDVRGGSHKLKVTP